MEEAFKILKSSTSKYQLIRNGALEAGADIVCKDEVIILPQESCVVATDLFIEFPPSFVAIIKGRSGLSIHDNIEVCSAGVIDSTYRGEIRVKLYNHGNETFECEPLSRIAQLLILPIALPVFTEVEFLSKSYRGDKGFGSSGIKKY